MAGEEEKWEVAPQFTMRTLLRRVRQEFADGIGMIAAFLAMAILLQCVYGGGSLLIGDNIDQSGIQWELSESGVPFGAFAQIWGGLAFGLLWVLSFWLTSAMLSGKWYPDFQKLPAWSFMMILSYVIIGLGFFFFIIPGIIFAVRLTPLLPLVITRGFELEMIGRSFDLTNRTFCPIFFVGLGLNLLYVFFS